MNILHVDDDPDIRDVAQLSLQLDPTFVVRSADSAAQALEMIAISAPDVILLDVMMPGMDGPDMFERLQSCPETAVIPVIFMTAAAQEQTAQDLIGLGAAGVISKPFDPLSLCGDVRNLL